MKKFTKELKQINNFLENAKEILENNTHCDRHNNYIAVNVKRYNDYVNVEELIDNMELSKVKKDFLEEEFTENYINDLYYEWLRIGAHYFTDDVMDGCRNENTGYWDIQITLIKEGQKTCYPDIEKLKTKEAKIKQIEKWKTKDTKELKYLLTLDNEVCGFFGRSSGWLGIKEVSVLQNKIDEIKYILSNSLNENNQFVSEDQEEIEGYIEDCLHFVDMPLINALNWIIKEITSFNKGLDFKNEIKYRIENMLEENPFMEDVETVNYAIN